MDSTDTPSATDLDQALEDPATLPTESDDRIEGTAAVDAIDARGGNDTVVGREGDDVLDGGAGDDQLFGDEPEEPIAGPSVYQSNDLLRGGAGDDYLRGSGGEDLLDGGTGNDTLDGGDENDVLVGGEGDDVLFGGNGGDTYQFGADWGRDIVYNGDREPGEQAPDSPIADVVSFDASVAPSEIALHRVGPYGLDLLITRRGSADSITIGDHFGLAAELRPTHELDAIRFADGTTWDRRAILDRLEPTPPATAPILGTLEDDGLVGTAGDDVIQGLSGNDRLQGLDGDDALDGGDGDDTLEGQDGRDLLDGGEGSDALFGQAGNDSLRGGAGDDLLHGGHGDDALDGGAGSDTYRFGLGFGHDVITSAYGNAPGDIDSLRLLWGITPANTVLRREGHGLELTVLGSDDRLWIDHFEAVDGSGGYQIQRISFGDGTVWDLAELLRRAGPPPAEPGDTTLAFGPGSGQLVLPAGTDRVLLDAAVTPQDVLLTRELDPALGGEGSLVLRLRGSEDRLALPDYFVDDAASTASIIEFADGTRWEASTVKMLVQLATDGDDRLYGYSGQDTLAGGLGQDLLVGFGGDDLLSGSDGDDALHGDGAPGAADTAVEGGRDELFGGQGDDRLFGGGGDDRLDGGLGEDTLLGQAGDDVLLGGGGNDRLRGGLGNDRLDGGLGDDQYIVGMGFGQDVIESFDGTAGKLDTVSLWWGITPDDTSLTRDGDSLVLDVRSSGDSLRIEHYFLGDGTAGWQVERLDFADGSSWDVAEVLRRTGTDVAAADAVDADTGILTARAPLSPARVGERAAAMGLPAAAFESRVHALVDAMAAFAPPSAGQASLRPPGTPGWQPELAAGQSLG